MQPQKTHNLTRIALLSFALTAAALLPGIAYSETALQGHSQAHPQAVSEAYPQAFAQATAGDTASPLELPMGTYVAPSADNAPPGLRCSFLAPLALSSYMDFIGRVGAENRSDAGIARRAGTTRDLIELYTSLGCPPQRLNQAFECLTVKVLAGITREAANRAAQDCMVEAKLAAKKTP